MFRRSFSAAAIAGLVALSLSVLGGPVAGAPLAAVDAPPVAPGAPAMGDYPVSDYAEAADALPDDLIRELAVSVDQTGAEYLAQADAAADASQVVDYLKDRGSVLGAHLDGTTLVVNVAKPAEAALARSLGADAVVGEPEKRDFGVDDAEFVDEIWSGEAIAYTANDGHSAYRCSLGFNGYSSASAAPEFVTAGHCFDGGTDPYYFLPQTAPDAFVGGADPNRVGNALPSTVEFGDGYDTGLIALEDTHWDGPGYVQTWSGTGGAPTNGMSIMGSIPAIEGASFCKSGSTTGWTCGEVLGTDYLVDVGPDDVVVNSVITDACVQPGDSGGAGLVGQLAVGVTSWSVGVPCSDPNYVSGFFPVESIGGYEDAYTANPDWELAAYVYPAMAIEPFDGDTYDVDESITGTLPVFGTSSRYAVDLYFDGASTPVTVGVSENGLWSYPVASLAPGSHSVVVDGRWGRWSHATTSTPAYHFTVAGGTISGVVHAGSAAGSTLGGVCVSVTGPVSASATTAGNGAYSIGDLPSGSYRVHFEDCNGDATYYEDAWYPNVDSSGASTAVPVGEGQTVALGATYLTLGGAFRDVRTTQTFFTEIQWMYDQGVSTGYVDSGARTYHPLDNVTREAMAAFLYRVSGSPAFTPPATPTFADVPSSAFFYPQIEWMYAQGITTGVVSGGQLLYQPADPVSREAMSAFLYRLAGSPSFAPPGTATFTDVPSSAFFFPQIEWMKANAITTGNADGTFAPSAPVSRQAMAAFLTRWNNAYG